MLRSIISLGLCMPLQGLLDRKTVGICTLLCGCFLRRLLCNCHLGHPSETAMPQLTLLVPGSGKHCQKTERTPALLRCALPHSL
jgi:hypothetical protein